MSSSSSLCAPPALSPLWSCILDDLPTSVSGELVNELSRRYKALLSAVRTGEAATWSSAVDFTVQVSGLPLIICLTEETLWADYVPLLAVLDAIVQQAGGSRACVGFVGAAGSGKTTFTQLLCAMYNTWNTTRPDHEEEDDACCACVSMDAYHKPNDALTAAGLKPYKGRIDTIDAGAFAQDLRRLKDATAAGSTVWVPVYDRLVTHDPVPAALAVGPRVRLVLAEGLYLCSGGDGGGSEAATAAPDAAAAAAWRSVRAHLDAVLHLDLPAAEGRARVVARKVAGGVAEPAAAAHYDRVDAPVAAALRARDAARPSTGALQRALRRQWRQQGGCGDAAVAPAIEASAPTSALEAAGPDLVLRISGAGGGETRVVGARLRGAACALPTAVPPPSADARVLILGLNPCVQKTLVFGAPPAAGAATATAAAAAVPAWQRGRVNRAAVAVHSAGGKGQHTAIACVRATAAFAAAAAAGAAAPAPLAVHLFQLLAGEAGRRVEQLLADTVAPLLLPPGAAAAAAPSAQLHVHSEWLLPGGANTRTCTTLVDAAAGDSTELIEPSAPAPAPLVDALLGQFAGALLPPGEEGAALAVALMGTMPPGATDAYARALQAVADAQRGRSPPAPPPLVLLDLSSGVLPLLRGGGVTVLKINADELHVVVAQAAASAAEEEQDEAGEPRSARIVRDALAMLLLGSDDDGGGLRHVAVTDGPHAAHLVSLRAPPPGPGGGGGGWSAAHHAFLLPPLPAPLVNPIGAGDTVAGTCLVLHARHGLPLPTALGHALAAGSASCCTLTGADWAPELQAAVAAGVRVATETLHGRRL